MSATQTQPSPPAVLNVPNVLTAIRLILAIAVFALIPWKQYSAAAVVFIVAASTDWIDGYWARKYKQVTKLGRIFDPFVDKVIICGTFTYLAAEPGSGIAAWVAVLILARELLVTALRAIVEQGGGDFSAKWVAKWKMVFQCIAAAASLIILAQPAAAAPAWMMWVLQVSLWATIATTVYSGAEYVVAASKLTLGND